MQYLKKFLLKIYFLFYHNFKKIKNADIKYFFIKFFKKNLIYIDQKTDLKFFVPNLLTYNRAKNLFFSEPETIEWINTFKSNTVFYDVGSNIGLYSLYCCKLNKNISIYSFEPSTNNLRVLSRNIYINNFYEKINIIPIPLSNDDGKFNLMKDNTFNEGGALNQYGVDYNFEGKKNILINGNIYKILGFSLNYFINTKLIKKPDYIKFDVDGIEHLILEGSSFLKECKNLEILIEINDNFVEQKKAAFDLLKSYDFFLKKKYENSSTSDQFKNTFNYLFIK